MLLTRQAGVVVILLFIGVESSVAQERFKFGAESWLKVEGTSNQSDWSVSADSSSGWIEISFDPKGVPTIYGANLRVVVSEMSGGRGPIMDRLMFRTLKVSDHSEIIYEVLEAEETQVNATASDSFNVIIRGNLTIAGQTRQIEMAVGAHAPDSGTMVFSGSHALKMSDYGMKPPTALFGALHTKDDVVVHFEMVIEFD